MPYTPPTKTLLNIMQVVKRQFGDESGVQLEDTDLLGWTQDAQQRINLESKVLKAKSSIASVANQGTYAFTSLPIQQIESLHFNGRRVPNMAFAQAEETVSQSDPNNTITASEPVLWYEWGGSFTLWPAPNAVGSIDVYYTASPTALVDSSSVLSIPDDFFNDVVNYVLQQAYEMDEDWQASQTKQAQFDESMVKRGEDVRSAQNMTYETITVIDDYYGY